MDYKLIDGSVLRDMLISGGQSLGLKKAEVDSLNVFPVPDGDTGTNMNLTMSSAVNEVKKIQNPSLKEVAKALALGSLMGARGNSGVILSQLFRGFAKVLESKEKFTPVDFAVGLNEGVKTAYKAVLKPVEGTILTVSKSFAKAALLEAQKGSDLIKVMETALAQGEVTLKQTPEMLPVLKQAGVVDSGGKGLLVIYEGWLKYLKGEEIVDTQDTVQDLAVDFVDEHPLDPSQIEFAYCTEFMIQGNNLEPDKIREELIALGDSLLTVGMDDLVKVHIHTNNPGLALEIGTRLGQIKDIKIENMILQTEGIKKEKESHIMLKKESAPKKDIGVIAVAAGKGLREILISMGVDHVIEGGQTMNPSTEDFLKAMDNVNADSFILLPNNSNIILAAQQAEKISTKPIKVVKTKTIPQGIAALLNYQSEGISLEDLHQVMEESISNVKSGQVTFAVRDSNFEDLQIKEGNILGIAENRIEVIGEDVELTTLELLDKLIDEDSEIVTLFYGEDITKEQGERLLETITEKYDHVEGELHQGGQPLYYYLISVE